MSIHIEPTTEEKRKEHKKTIKGFALLILVAAFAGGVGFIEGQYTQTNTQKATVSDSNPFGLDGKYTTPWARYDKDSGRLKPGDRGYKDDQKRRNIVKKDKKKDVCGPGDSRKECLDKCSTTYVEITAKGTPSVKNCDPLKYDDNPIGKAIKEYSTCVQEVYGQENIKTVAYDRICLEQPTKINFKQAKDKFKGVGFDKGQTKTAQAGYNKAIEKLNKNLDKNGDGSLEKIFPKCNKQLKAVYDAKKKAIAAGAKKQDASYSDSEKCAWKQVSNCTMNGAKLNEKKDRKSTKYTCNSKKAAKQDKKGVNKDGAKCKAGEENCKNVKGEVCKKIDKTCTIKNPDTRNSVNGQGGNTTLPGGGGNDYLNNPNTQKKKGKSSPITDFLKGLTGGKKGGGGGSKQQQKKAKTPTCTLNISSASIKRGERIRIKWTSSYAKRVDITNIGRVNVDSPSQGFTRAPSVKTTYALTATSKDGKSKCTKSVTVNVEGSVDGKKGAYPPRLSCTPSKAELGKKTKAEVTWSCPTKADKSKGVDFDTEGKLAKTLKFNIDVTDKNSKTFTVQCLEKDKVIGENSCTIKIVKSVYDIIAWPTEVETDERVRVSWGALNMQSCTVKGLNNFNYNQQNGVIITTPFPKGVSNGDEVSYVMTCKTVFGKTVTKDVVVKKK